MKVLILNAGTTKSYGKYGFPPNSKPKCLFHYGGEVLLERQVKLLREFGIKNITILVGYKREQIIEFVKRKNLNLKFIESPVHIQKDCLLSLKAGLNQMDDDDDLLIVSGDCYFSRRALKAFLDKKASLLVFENVVDCDGVYLVKIAKEKIWICQEIDKYGHKNYILWSLCKLLYAHNTSRIKRIDSSSRYNIFDVDYYKYTDEGRQSLVKSNVKT